MVQPSWNTSARSPHRGQAPLTVPFDDAPTSPRDRKPISIMWRSMMPPIAASKLGTKDLNLAAIIDPSAPPRLVSDSTRLRQILNNLLSNAVKFTAAGEVSLEVSRHDCHIGFAVRDTGPGIPPESRETIFEKFKQLENFLTREHGGTGLGLALVKQLAEHMGGRIEMESEVGVGSTFTVYLPLDGTHD